MHILEGLLPKTIYQGSTPFNKDIKVIQAWKTRKLIVDGLVQSCSIDSDYYKHKVWHELAKAIRANKPEVKNLLMLGTGAGTVVQIMNKKFKMNGINTILVEIDKEIVDISRKYFDLDLITNSRIIIADANEVLQEPETYMINSSPECILVDTFMGDKYPVSVDSAQFLKNLFKLADNGTFIIFNRVFNKDGKGAGQFKHELGIYMDKIETKVVKGSTTSQNVVFYGYKSTDKLPVPV
ncbi:MAG: hypothetical protein UU80_C0002G0005 [candidate division WWE3 bacterium GW2011_GWA1_41_8]|uniref:Spermidine synthase n=3 Tax=Katanobacteria TaxID=422282 RepID=A0A0G1ABX6_UNCKA|nr:MAG: hypothetical protein UU72_C0004G0009 [candidate division WWE3 bacterium GW2011_GWB1_41_6]KKS22773.1 MAG: hypothetical protein UU80_C0002G0005 [candidate division WWE3 bacterium GW2011_GWA1_41_8]OGC58047.1 MAG: hypothetical protein A2976_01305 [candidate division WWE3 bacterium RIFCSPLOWO2_01_FULL_41_9]